MVDPSRLMASATRLYGADMERLWGEMRPAAAARVRILRGGEQIEVAGRTLRSPTRPDTPHTTSATSTVRAASRSSGTPPG